MATGEKVEIGKDIHYKCNYTEYYSVKNGFNLDGLGLGRMS